MADFNAQVIEEFHANDGVVGGMFEGAPLLLLHHVGAKSGTSRIAPLVYLLDGENYVIYASKGGAPEHPAWYHNLLASPNVEIEVASQRLSVIAEQASGEERSRLYAAQVAAQPQFGEYQKNTDREIPVMVLRPR